ncbi:MAG: hypothetical protein EPN88_08120 [Bacteroidetes bacterium]|nr:MAG: hypothetical protein EPN88_08120 [Bacteroidota bacterium]
MKKKNALKKAAIKLDLEKIEIDVLSDSMLNGLQGGYNTYDVTCVTACNSVCYTRCDPQGQSWCWLCK